MEAAGLVLSEITHRLGRKLPEHTHQSAYFGLLLDGGYTERFTERKRTRSSSTARIFTKSARSVWRASSRRRLPRSILRDDAVPI
jgi:hypothetical protein